MNPSTAAIIVGIIWTTTGPVTVLSSPVDMWEVPKLKALAMIESGCNDFAKGKKGERSRYQILPSTWKEVSNKSFSSALYPQIASQAASCYLNRLSNRFYTTNLRRPSDLDLYVMWNWGFAKYERAEFKYEKVPAKVRDAAERFSNLVYMYKQHN